MTCREIVDFLMQYIDGELNPQQRDRFEAHLVICPDCVEYLHTYRQTVALGQEALREPQAIAALPEDLVKAVLNSLRNSSPVE
jgi:anti-sigma factor RsiW